MSRAGQITQTVVIEAEEYLSVPSRMIISAVGSLAENASIRLYAE
jgi:hypothetical protein